MTRVTNYVGGTDGRKLAEIGSLPVIIDTFAAIGGLIAAPVFGD
jgi:hypothetical protein